MSTVTEGPPAASSAERGGSGGTVPPEDGPRLLDDAEAEELATRIQAHAAHVAEAECALLDLIGEFDAGEGTRWYVGVKSLAHWLGWTCSMTPGTAREHVRVARALRGMPLTHEEFARGRLSFSKVREMTRVAGLVDEETLVLIAREMTAAQLASALRAYRAAEGTRIPQEARREASWRMREDGMIEVRAVLPAEVGAEVAAALDLATQREQDAGDVPADAEQDVPPIIEQTRADALVDMARAYLDTTPADRSGEDRHLVVVHATPDMLVSGEPRGSERHEGSVAAHRSEPTRDLTDLAVGDVPAGTPATDAGTHSATRPDASAASPPLRNRCEIVGAGPLEAATAQRLACTGLIALLVTDENGEILHLGRTRRLASRAQRRALRVAQRTCGFPGCHQTRHLDAHHLAPWSSGGGTDIENLVLLCRRHHVLVHEGGLTIRPTRSSAPHAPADGPRFDVLDSTGAPVQTYWPHVLEQAVIVPLEPEHPLVRDGESGPRYQWGEGDTRIAPTTAGFAFRLRDVVDALYGSDPDPDPDE
ncbi:HNH endonuclease signature motif containing protein [Brachybacterium sp. ACRRE]|uniref:HNH endonuclease signature motif containing protein n=1 Tax=Brachybacterium sp. ACRRE TaxID=2918184 RepID=UPI001EF2456D|nr:HNH endonuclease signature motif containing protein [Brachybacterium sp. ACRRE]MCG7308150.1 HNH endonuclease [Brachybacterium sp. ACRRE]